MVHDMALVHQSNNSHLYSGVYYPNYYKSSDGGHVLEHVLVYERYYNCILPWALIHHKDGNRQNNDISNLGIMSWGAHTILHRTKTYEEL